MAQTKEALAQQADKARQAALSHSYGKTTPSKHQTFYNYIYYLLLSSLQHQQLQPSTTHQLILHFILTTL